MKRSNYTSALLAQLFSETEGMPLEKRLLALAEAEPTIARFANAPMKASVNWLDPSEVSLVDFARLALVHLPHLDTFTAAEIFLRIQPLLRNCPKHINVFGRLLLRFARETDGFISSYMSAGLRRYIFDHDKALAIIEKAE